MPSPTPYQSLCRAVIDYLDHAAELATPSGDEPPTAADHAAAESHAVSILCLITARLSAGWAETREQSRT
jgi:hypothetical protein